MPRPQIYKTKMPALFVGHGSPMNAIEDNEFSRGWKKIAQDLPRPKAVLCVSAHWETAGVRVTAMDRPPTIHDFGGFPRELYEVQYPAPGSAWLTAEVKKAIAPAEVALDSGWGLDHGCWSVLSRMYPSADVPVVQLSLDTQRSAREHYDLAKGLAPLREKGVLVAGSGNLVHNLGLVQFSGDGPDDFSRPFGFDWAIEANTLFKKLINENVYEKLADYHSLGRTVRLAVPTPEHYLPMLYALALKEKDESVAFFNDVPVAGSLSMTSFVVDSAG
jgi:4,5-DOPA dioxygenase extradiol